jgi:hypothetical protein
MPCRQSQLRDKLDQRTIRPPPLLLGPCDTRRCLPSLPPSECWGLFRPHIFSQVRISSLFLEDRPFTIRRIQEILSLGIGIQFPETQACSETLVWNEHC